MPILRNPFAKRQEQAQDDLSRPYAPPTGLDSAKDVEFNTPKRTAILRSSSSGSEPGEYQMSEIGDDGNFIPPSPAESKRSFWYSRSNGSTASSSFRSAHNENEPFNMSRESFDSYRRSFDISARSPVIDPAASSSYRASLDSRRARLPSAALGDRHINVPEAQPEELMEDVGLGDEVVKPTKKRNIFARFGDSEHHNDSGNRPGSSGHASHSFFGRKRGQSGQGAELGSMPNDFQIPS